MNTLSHIPQYGNLWLCISHFSEHWFRIGYKNRDRIRRTLVDANLRRTIPSLEWHRLQQRDPPLLAPWPHWCRTCHGIWRNSTLGPCHINPIQRRLWISAKRFASLGGGKPSQIFGSSKQLLHSDPRGECNAPIPVVPGDTNLRREFLKVR